MPGWDGRPGEADERHSLATEIHTQAVEFALAGKTHKLDLTAQSLVAWRELRESLGRAPTRKEVVAWVEKKTGVKFTLRQWRRVFTDLIELFEQSK